jgi:uncharacterized membrane protein
MNPVSEIGTLEHELENLRASYASMQRGAMYLRSFFVAVLIGSLLVITYSLITMNIPVMGLGALIACVTGAIIVCNRRNWTSMADIRLWGARLSDLEAVES